MVEVVLPHKSLDYGNTSEIRIGDTFLGCCINSLCVKAIDRFGILDVRAAKVVAVIDIRCKVDDCAERLAHIAWGPSRARPKPQVS